MKKRVFVASVLMIAALAGCGRTSDSAPVSGSNPTSDASVPGSDSPVVTKYAVVVSASDHATLTVDKESAAAGETVTITADVDEDYGLESVMINGEPIEPKDDGTYSFVMPEGQVTVSYSAIQTKFAVVLPEGLPEGITMALSQEGHLESGTQVDLYVTDVSEGKKVKSVKLNGTELEGVHSNVADCTIYHFEMPGAEANITASIVDVYHVSVAADVAQAFGLDGNLEAEAGETVEFVPAVFSGFWAKDFLADYEDVTILPVDGKPNHYSFVMPAHDVAISATIGQVAYRVTYENRYVYKITFDEDTKKEAYDVGDIIKFKVDSASKDADVLGCKGNGVDLGEPDEEGYYSFTAKAMENVIEPIMDYHYKTVAVVSTDHFDYTLTTKDRFTDQEEGVVDTVLSNQYIFINATEKAGIDQNDFVPTSFKIYGGADEASAVDVTSSLTISMESTYRYCFSTKDTHAYYRIEPIEEECPFKNNTIVGVYDTGMKPYFGGNYKAEVSVKGIFRPSSKCDYESTPSFSSYDSMTLTPDTTDPNHFTDPKSSAKHVFYNGTNAILYVTGTNSSGSSLFAKGFEGSASTDSGDSNHSYTYALKSGYSLQKQFYHLEGKNGQVVTAYYDFATNKVLWNVTAELARGVDGSTVGDIIMIKDAAGTVLDVYQVSVSAPYGDGYQHTVKAVTLDGYEGTYTAASAADGTDDFVVTGYGIVTIGGVEYHYTMEDGFLAVTMNDVVHYYLLNKEAMTYQVSKGPSDGFEGTYTYGENTVVVDGYGVAKIGEADYTYTIKNGRLILTDGTNTITVSVDKTNMTLTDYVAPDNPFLENTYEGSEIDSSYYENFIKVTFTTESEAAVKLSYEDSDGYTTNYKEATCSYLLSDDTVTISVPSRSGTSSVDLILTQNEDDNLVVSGSSGFYYDYGFQVSAGVILYKK